MKTGGGYTATLGGATYTVVYQMPQDGVIYLPESGSFEVSSDNTGGYVVTARS